MFLHHKIQLNKVLCLTNLGEKKRIVADLIQIILIEEIPEFGFPQRKEFCIFYCG
jgi:hypothetical protein